MDAIVRWHRMLPQPPQPESPEDEAHQRTTRLMGYLADFPQLTITGLAPGANNMRLPAGAYNTGLSQFAYPGHY